MLQLLKLGLDWEAIMQMTEAEINIVLGVEMAIRDKQNEAEARSMAGSGGSF
jgi:hypothetical protein|tara:strand:- start:4769 stop:4924 length:156 start_codon:yes stop_codon:yes gene_type:complete